MERAMSIHKNAPPGACGGCTDRDESNGGPIRSPAIRIHAATTKGRGDPPRPFVDDHHHPSTKH
jgi:hypothetical protein